MGSRSVENVAHPVRRIIFGLSEAHLDSSLVHLVQEVLDIEWMVVVLKALY